MTHTITSSLAFISLQTCFQNFHLNQKSRGATTPLAPLLPTPMLKVLGSIPGEVSPPFFFSSQQPLPFFLLLFFSPPFLSLLPFSFPLTRSATSMCSNIILVM